MPKRPFIAFILLIIVTLSLSITLYADSHTNHHFFLPVIVHQEPQVPDGPVNGTPFVKINFQPASSPLPVGYQLDNGLVFGNRGNGFTYGWNAENSSTTRDRDQVADQRYDTLIHLQKPENADAFWEIELPNGTYEIFVVAGDPNHFNSVFHLLAEGEPILEMAGSAGNHFATAVFQTHVQDGRLTLSNGSNASNNKLSFLEINLIEQDPVVPTPTPQPPQGTTTEFRGLWVSRFDWTSASSGTPEKIDQIVVDAAYAGFNAIFFQVRGEADAFYTPGLEPWSRRLTGTLGQDPGWDPLARMIEKAHAQGIQVHAYLNIYPVWTGCNAPPDNTSPRHLYHKLRDVHGTTDGKPNGLQWYNGSGDVACSSYQRATPASVYHDDHILAVARDLVTRYDVDGIHLDHIRYNSSTTSCDPVSLAAFGSNCFGHNGSYSFRDWQRRQVNGTVNKFYEQIVPLKQGLWLSAAVWPMYIDYWGWGGQEGYHDYYQDSKAWIQGGYIDAISPMIYPSTFDCENPGFWTQSRWQTLVANFQGDSNGRFIVPGIGTGYCTFDEIEARINMARSIGTAGHALFAYGGLARNGYFDDLRNGPYAETAVPPTITWHP